MINAKIDQLITSQNFIKRVEQITNYPNYSQNERGFEVYEKNNFSIIVKGDESNILYPENDKKTLIRVHYHPHNYPIPSLIDLFNDLIFSFNQSKKWQSIPYLVF